MEGWSVRARLEGGHMHMEGVECACMGSGRVCVWKVEREGVYMEGVKCACMGRGCVHMEGVECAWTRRGMIMYMEGWSVCARKFGTKLSDPFLSFQICVWLTRLCLSKF